MNKQIDEILKAALEDNARVMDLAHDLYKAGRRSVPKGLPGVTEQQVGLAITYLSGGLAQGLADWFNDPSRNPPVKHPEWTKASHEKVVGGTFVSDDAIEQFVENIDPDRDAPVKRPMHPDLEWLARVPPERFEGIPRRRGEERTPYFFRYASHGGHYDDRLGWGFDPAKAPKGVSTFTLAEIEQARRHLAEKRLAAKAQRLKELEAERDAHLVEDWDFNSLPDYETWFERHGWETVNRDTRMAAIDSDVPATVHELYSMFRARLLDELHQAGVIGDKQ